MFPASTHELKLPVVYREGYDGDKAWHLLSDKTCLWFTAVVLSRTHLSSLEIYLFRCPSQKCYHMLFRYLKDTKLYRYTNNMLYSLYTSTYKNETVYESVQLNHATTTGTTGLIKLKFSKNLLIYPQVTYNTAVSCAWS